MLDSLFNPVGVAVIGASGKELHIGNRVIKNLLDFGYQGGIYPINPKADEIRGIKAYPSILDVPGQVDVAHMVIPARFVPAAVEDCGKKGVRHIIINSGGFFRNRPRGRRDRKGISGKSQSLRHPHFRPQLPGNHQFRSGGKSLLQFHVHLSRGRSHLHCGPVRRGGRGHPPGILRHGRGNAHLRLQRQRLRHLHPGDHPLPGRGRRHPGHRHLRGGAQGPHGLSRRGPGSNGQETRSGHESRPHHGRRPGSRVPHRWPGQGGHGYRPDFQEGRYRRFPGRRAPDQRRRGFRLTTGSQRKPSGHHHQHRWAGGDRHRHPGGCRPDPAPAVR